MIVPAKQEDSAEGAIDWAAGRGIEAPHWSVRMNQPQQLERISSSHKKVLRFVHRLEGAQRRAAELGLLAWQTGALDCM